MKDYPIIKTKVEKNGTHVTAHHRLMESLLCLNKGLHIYKVQKMESIGGAVTVTYANWKQFGELKAVLNIKQVTTTISHYEERYVASYGKILKLLTYKTLTSGELRIINQDELTKHPEMTWNISDVN